jgi:hypothetical protein
MDKNKYTEIEMMPLSSPLEEQIVPLPLPPNSPPTLPLPPPPTPPLPLDLPPNPPPFPLTPCEKPSLDELNNDMMYTPIISAVDFFTLKAYEYIYIVYPGLNYAICNCFIDINYSSPSIITYRYMPVLRFDTKISEGTFFPNEFNNPRQPKYYKAVEREEIEPKGGRRKSKRRKSKRKKTRSKKRGSKKRKSRRRK